MEKITQLLFCEVISADGERLGHVFDLRCQGEPEHGLVNQERRVSELLYGTRGLLELLGFRETSVQSVEWKYVRRIENGKIIVAENYKAIEVKTADDRRASRS